MSRSRNVRSRYQAVPDYVKVSVSVRDAGERKRSRDSRASSRHELRGIVRSILQDSKEV